MFTMSVRIYNQRPEGPFVVTTTNHHTSPNAEILHIIQIVLSGSDEIK